MEGSRVASMPVGQKQELRARIFKMQLQTSDQTERVPGFQKS